jgi:hypothetical protein
MNIGKIYIRPLNLITYRTFNSEYYSNLRKKRKQVFVQKEPKKIFTNYGSFQNFDKTKWSPDNIVVEMKSLKMDNSHSANDANDADDEWVDVKKIL